MELTTIAGRIEKIAVDAAAKCDVEFVHAEVVGAKRNMTVRVYVDKPEGVTLDDCSMVSRVIEEVIDADDFIPAAYVLEVSSPGLERGLYTIQDFERFSGKRAKVKTSVAIEAQTNFNGRITSVEDGEIIFDDKTKGAIRIPFKSIVKANLRVDLAEEFKRR